MAERDEAIWCPEMGLGCDRCVTLWCAVPGWRQGEGSISGHVLSMERFLLSIGFYCLSAHSGRQPQHFRGSGVIAGSSRQVQTNDSRNPCQKQSPEQPAYL